MNYYAKAFQLFVRSLRPSVFRGKKTFLVGKDHLGNQYFECPAGNFIQIDLFKGLNKYFLC